MIKEEKSFIVTCDCCGEFLDNDGIVMCYPSEDEAKGAAADSEFLELGGKWYCPDCYKIEEGENGDVIKTNDGKIFDWDTRNEIHND